MEEVSNISNAVIMIYLICREVDYKGRKTKKVASKLLRNHTRVVWDIFHGLVRHRGPPITKAPPSKAAIDTIDSDSDR